MAVNFNGGFKIGGVEYRHPLSSEEIRFLLTILNPRKFIELKIINGTVMILNRLITAVRDIDKATSPFAYEVSTFDVTPPGAAAIINNPTASSGDIGQTLINKIATKGKIRI